MERFDRVLILVKIFGEDITVSHYYQALEPLKRFDGVLTYYLAL